MQVFKYKSMRGCAGIYPTLQACKHAIMHVGMYATMQACKLYNGVASIHGCLVLIMIQ